VRVRVRVCVCVCVSVSSHLANELEHCHLQNVAPAGHVVDVFKQVPDRPILRVVGEHDKRVAPSAEILLVP